MTLEIWKSRGKCRVRGMGKGRDLYEVLLASMSEDEPCRIVGQLLYAPLG
jgi:hypothetical protein